MAAEAEALAQAHRTEAAALALGISLGGFFDGIVLHQILQWHHLLSAVQTGALADLRAQVAMDGLFHLLMYVIALAALVMLWRGRGAMDAATTGRRLWGKALLGFALWHAADAVLSHWLLGIHRIRMDTPHPLLWDVGWLAVFGGGAAVAGWTLLRRRGGAGGGGRLAAGGLAALAVLAGPLAAMPPPGSDLALVLFRQPVDPVRLAGFDLLPVWSDASGHLWVVRADGASLEPLYAHGALALSRTLLPAACLSWSRP